jgi:hypothetical protein
LPAADPPGGSVLDVACGSAATCAGWPAQGLPLTGVDRDPAALEPTCRACTRGAGRRHRERPLALAGRRFDAVVVTNYLWRALLPAAWQRWPTAAC